jgi:hypothetical protein
MAMTEKERGFLEYMVSRGNKCANNLSQNTEKILDKKYADCMLDLAYTIKYYTGCMDTYNDLIDAYKHTFGEK